MAPDPCRVLVVDDDVEWRRLLRIALGALGDCEVVAEAQDARSAFALARAEQPDVIVIDHGIPTLCRLEVVPALRSAAPSARIVLFTSLAGARTCFARCTVDAIAFKDRPIAETVAAIVGPPA
jgi:two-component system, NarL family, nitrate/nitrite response regulator NarL